MLTTRKILDASERVFASWVVWSMLLLAAFLGVNSKLVLGRAVGTWDVDAWYMPWQILVYDFARAGKFVLWDPWTNGGLAAGGDPQVAAFSPISVAIGLLFGGSTGTFRLYWLLMWWLGGLGIMLLARHLRVPPYAAFVIALGYLFGGIYLGNAEHTSAVVGYSAIPFIIWRLDKALASQSYIPALQAGAIWGLSALAGYPSLTILTVFYCGMWVVGRMFFSDNEWVRAGDGNSGIRPTFAITAFLAVVIVGCIVLSPTYVGFLYEGAGTTSRTEALSREAVIGENPLVPGALSTLASPFLPVQKLANPSLYAGTDISMTNVYAGVAVSVFSLFALISGWRERWRWWLLFIGLVAIVCALSTVFPLRGWLYDLVYPTRFFRHASIFRAYFLFSITVLALYGIRDLARSIGRSETTEWRRFAVAAHPIAAAAILVFVFTLAGLSSVGPKGLIGLSTAHICLWIVMCIASYVAATKARVLLVPLLLLVTAVCDAYMVVRLSSATLMASDTAWLNRWKELDEIHVSDIDLTGLGLRRDRMANYEAALPAIERNSDQLITKVPVLDAYNTQVNQFQVEMMKHTELERMAIGSDRIWFSTEAVEMPLTREGFRWFAETAQKLGRAPLVVHRADQMLGTVDTAAGPPTGSDPLPLEPIQVELIRYEPERLAFRTHAPADGWILVTDRWARCWSVEINGAPAELYGGNFIFRAVRVHAGANTIEFTYRPISSPYLLSLSWGLLGLVTLLSLYQANRKVSRAKPVLPTTRIDSA
jgi:hypothetical protein